MPEVSPPIRKEFGPEVLSAPSTDASFDNFVKGIRNIPTALTQISRDPKTATQLIAKPATTGAALGLQGGPLSAVAGGLSGAALGLMSYGNPAADKLLQDVDALTSLPQPTALGMVSTGGKVLSNAEHDALAAEYYMDKLPKIAKQVKGKFYSSDVDDLVGQGAERLMDLFRDTKVKDFPNSKELNDYLGAMSRKAMEDYASRHAGVVDKSAELADDFTTMVGNPEAAAAPAIRESVEAAFDNLLGKFLRPRDRVIFERTRNAQPTVGRGNIAPGSSRQLAEELGMERRNIQNTIPFVKAQVQNLGQKVEARMKSQGLNLEQAVNEVVAGSGPNYAIANKAYRKDLLKMHPAEKVFDQISKLDPKIQGPMRDYLRGFSPYKLERKWDGDSTPDKLYHAFKMLEDNL